VFRATTLAPCRRGASVARSSTGRSHTTGFQDQLVYLDARGAQMSCTTPVTIQDIDIDAFEAPASLAGRARDYRGPRGGIGRHLRAAGVGSQHQARGPPRFRHSTLATRRGLCGLRCLYGSLKPWIGETRTRRTEALALPMSLHQTARTERLPRSASGNRHPRDGPPPGYAHTSELNGGILSFSRGPWRPHYQDTMWAVTRTVRPDR